MSAPVVRFADAPPGLFIHNGVLCFKSEYYSTPDKPDAYVVRTGEYWWGGTHNSSERLERLVELVAVMNVGAAND